MQAQVLDRRLPAVHCCSSLVQGAPVAGTPRGESLTLATVLPLVARRTLRPTLATHRVTGYTWLAGATVSAAWSEETWLTLCRVRGKTELRGGSEALNGFETDLPLLQRLTRLAVLSLKAGLAGAATILRVTRSCV